MAITIVAIPATRQIIIQLFTQDRSFHNEIISNSTHSTAVLTPTQPSPDRNENFLSPTYLPKGFTEKQSIITEASTSYVWSSNSGKQIFYDQQLKNSVSFEDSVPKPGVTPGDAEVLSLNGYKVTCYKGVGITYRWTDDLYSYQIYCDPGISQEELNKIFFSLSENKDAS